MTTTEPTKHELLNDDTVFVGSATEIIEQMREQAYFERGIPLDSYLSHLIDLILQSAGVEIVLTGENFPERAECFVSRLVELGYFKEA